MQLILPYNIVNQTPADAVQVDTNHDTIADFVNSQVINRDGTVSMDAPLLLKGNPSATNHAVNMGFLKGFLPVGVIMPFGGTAAPAGDWLLCDGASKSTTTYKDLFNVLGYRYGGSGGNFNLPNMKGRFPIGMDAAQTEFSATGKKGGSFTVPVPQHKHAMPHTHPIDHDHAQFDTLANKTDHIHSIAHDHGNINTSGHSVNHAHSLSMRQNSTPGTTGSHMSASGTGTSVAANTNPADVSHTHQVNMPNYAGNSGVNTTDHVHPANVPKFTGPSGAVSATHTADVGTKDVELQPPFVVVNYIIRAA